MDLSTKKPFADQAMWSRGFAEKPVPQSKNTTWPVDGGFHLSFAEFGDWLAFGRSLLGN